MSGWGWDDEEEEEEDERPAPGAVAGPGEHEEKEEESLDQVWLQSYLRQRPSHRPTEEAELAGFTEAAAGPEPSSSSSASRAPDSDEAVVVQPPSWHLAVGLVLGVSAWLQRTVPDESSLQEALKGRYGREPPAKVGRVLLPDRSFGSHPNATSWQNHWFIALGRATVQQRDHVYEHSYLGLGGYWLALPYLPRVWLKGGGYRYGLGICHSARCICVPGKKAPCKQMVWDTSSLLSLVLGLNILLFLAGLATQGDQFHFQAAGGWSLAAAMRSCTLTLPGLRAGNYASLLLAPFYHRGFLEFMRNMMLLANTIEAAAKHGGSHGSLLFLTLYISGSVAHFLGCCCALSALGPSWLVPLEALNGCRGGLSAVLGLLAQVAPNERYRFSLYMVEVPTPLSPLATLAANALVDASFASARGRFAAEVAGHLAALALGTFVARVAV